MEEQSLQRTGEAPVISIRGLHRAFDEFEVLRGIDMDVFRGENVVVLGRSGAGKSVLIKIIVGLLPPGSGSVSVLGHDISRLDKKGWRQLRLQTGFLFQGSALYDSMTVEENLLFPLTRNFRSLAPRQAQAAVDAVLEAVGLEHTRRQMPSELSGGQQKRIAIARTLILKPQIMLYDEPTAGLDPITSAEINNLINEVRERYRCSSIIITHDLTCARMTGDRVLMLHQGKFIREGTFDQVFATEDERIRGFFDYNTYATK
ncbi:ATP-binding cassette domain-containing protein [Paraflavisolibacter sp. H34]|uniref:ABC transporter ATP-binding protein n=1 Tax=Huijunlia imazamoxiresistens TaxID=3127457 RepID=UPI00301A6EE8